MVSSEDCPVPEPYKGVHKLSALHRYDVMKSARVGCFYCGETYSPTEIEQWTDDGRTAICPKCHVDSVLPDSTSDISKEFLDQMHFWWFRNGGQL